jgi:hypothetical protein
MFSIFHYKLGLKRSVNIIVQTVDTRAAPGTSYSYITIHLMGVPTPEVRYTSATTGSGDHEVYQGYVVQEKIASVTLLFWTSLVV